MYYTAVLLDNSKFKIIYNILRLTLINYKQLFTLDEKFSH